MKGRLEKDCTLPLLPTSARINSKKKRSKIHRTAVAARGEQRAGGGEDREMRETF